MPDVTTKCFHTRDAVSTEEGSFTFEMPHGKLREEASKVLLASCEFPMVQWTVEDAWNRIWFCEGAHLADGENEMRLVVRYPGGEEHHEALRVPPRLNRIAKTCATPHGLECFRGDVHLLGDAGGTVHATLWEVMDEISFALTCDADAPTFCYVPAYTSPSDLCLQLTRAAQSFTTATLRFSYEAATDRVLAAGSFSCASARVRLLPCYLTRLLGLSTTSFTVSDYTMLWPSERTRLWSHTRIPPGFYAPCHRSMCVGQPLRLINEVELAVNRFYFPLLQDDQEHLLVFGDPSGNVLTCSIPFGRHTPEGFATILETGMTAAMQRFDKQVEVSVSVSAGRFTFACERVGGGIECVFAILFNHPLCIDGARLGFANQPFTGSTSYTSTDVVVFDQCMSNLLRMSEIGCQKRFRFHAVAPPAMAAVCVSPGVFRTFVNGVAFAHGYRPGDVVRVSVQDAQEVRGDGEKIQIGETVAKLPALCLCVVEASDHPMLLALDLPPIDGLRDKGTGLKVHSNPQPLNLHFGLPESVPAHLVGAHQPALQWGIDGSVEDGQGRHIPPFELKSVHTLDHPDYVLMTFSESSSGSFEHSYDGEQKSVFCKLSLYPLFREERMLPRDTTLLRQQLSQFTLSFWNPDFRTPYHFHGAQFSFSLSFLS
jgi:hypothetical protein